MDSRAARDGGRSDHRVAQRLNGCQASKPRISVAKVEADAALLGKRAFDESEAFNTRYSTFGFNDKANLDEAGMWPVAFALKELAATDEARIVALVKKAAG
jgi:hypothetical protein